MKKGKCPSGKEEKKELPLKNLEIAAAHSNPASQWRQGNTFGIAIPLLPLFIRKYFQIQLNCVNLHNYKC